MGIICFRIAQPKSWMTGALQDTMIFKTGLIYALNGRNQNGLCFQ